MLSQADAPSSALLTDLYQLTMLQGYYDQAMAETAVFEFFVRKLPAQRNFLIAAGLEQALDYLEKIHFTPPELDWIAGHGMFRPEFVRYLENFRFTGDVHAMAEGTVFYPNEPILRVIAPIAEAQLIESRLINLLHFETLIASKAARSVTGRFSDKTRAAISRRRHRTARLTPAAINRLIPAVNTPQFEWARSQMPS